MERLSKSGEWTRTGPLNDPAEFGLIQPAILSHPGGALQALCRSRQGKIVSLRSADGGKTWSKPEATNLANPNSGIDAVTLRDGRHLLVYNPVERGRTPLSVAVSEDGVRWTKVADLETEPGEYSYPAIVQGRDGLVHIAYTWRRERIKRVVFDLARNGPVRG
jgi:predicted neuraminidase